MKTKKYILSVALFLALFLATYYFVLKDYPLQELMQSIQSCQPGFIALAILLTFTWGSCEALYLKRMLHHFGYKISWFQAYGYVCTLCYFSAITPSSMGGQPVQMIEMNKDGIPYRINTMIVLLNTLIYKIALIVLAVIAFIIYHEQLFTGHMWFTVLVLVGFVTTIFVIIGFMMLIYSKRVINWLLDLFIKILKKIKFVKNVEQKEKHLKDALKGYQECAKFTKKHPKVLVESFAILLVQRLANLAISYAIYLSFGLGEMSIFEVIAFQICITLGSDFMPSPGGVMVSEGLLLEANQLIYGTALATSGMILLRSISFYGIVTVAFIFYLIFHFTKRKKVGTLKLPRARKEEEIE